MKPFSLIYPVFLSTLLAAGALAQNPAVVPVPRHSPTNWLARHEGFVAQAKKGGIDLLFLGDSITDNWRRYGVKVWNQYYAPLHAANFGIGGDRTQHVLWRIENGELDGISPKVIVLVIGTNNTKTDSADDIVAGIEKIVAVICEKCPKSKILLLAIFPRNKPVDKPDQMEIINQVNARIASLDDGKMIRFLNINDQFLGPDGKMRADLTRDRLHPNAEGYEVWARAMEPILAAMVR
jgi:lysophospholipase L1-like esterase